MCIRDRTRSISPENFTGEKGKGGMADPVRDKDQRLSLIHIFLSQLNGMTATERAQLPAEELASIQGQELNAVTTAYVVLGLVMLVPVSYTHLDVYKRQV